MSLANILKSQSSISPGLLKEFGRPRRDLLDTVLTPLRTAGYVLDSIGGPIRTALVRPEDFVESIYRPSKRASGSELLGYDKNKFTWGGLGLEVLLDPTTFATFGAKTAAGKLATRLGKLSDKRDALKALTPNVLNDTLQRTTARRLTGVEDAIGNIRGQQTALGRTAGEVLPETLSEQSQAGLRSGLSFDVPFTGINIPLTSGSNTFSFLDKLGSAIPAGTTVEKLIRPLFDTGSFVDKEGKLVKLTGLQKELIKEGRILNREAESIGSRVSKELQDKIKEISSKSGTSIDDVVRLVQQNVESGAVPVNASIRSDILDTASLVKDRQNEIANILRGAGKPFEEFDSSKVGYLARQVTPKGLKFLKDSKQTIKAVEKKLKLAKAGGIFRRRFGRDLPIDEANKLARDEFGIDFDFYSVDIPTIIGSRTSEALKGATETRLTQGFLDLFGTNRGQSIASIYKRLGKRGLPLRGEVLGKPQTVGVLTRPGEDVTFENLIRQKGNPLVSSETSTATGDVFAQTDGIDLVQAVGLDRTKKGPHTLRIAESDLENFGIEGTIPPELIKEGSSPLAPSKKTILDKVRQPIRIVDEKGKIKSKEANKLLKEEGVNYRLANEDVEVLEQGLSLLNNPNQGAGVLKLVDNVNAAYRGLLTVLFPAYHVRNGLSGIFMNTLAGAVDPSLYARSMSEIGQLSADEVTRLEGLGVLGKGLHEETRELINRSDFGRRFDRATSIPGKALNTGFKAGQAVDNLNRYALYLDGIKKGLSETEAAERVLKYHFDYNDLTAFEKKYARRGTLFYTFMRKNIPLMMEQLVRNPRVMQLYNRATGGTNPNLDKPAWLPDSFFFGDQSLSLGLPPEDLTRFSSEGKGFQRFFSKLLGLTNPIVGGAIENLTGKDLFLDKPLEGSLANRLISTSPLARFEGIARRGSEDGLLNEFLRTGLALNIRDMDSKSIQRSNAISNIKQLLEGEVRRGKGRKFEVFSNRPGQENERLNELNKILNSLYRN